MVLVVVQGEQGLGHNHGRLGVSHQSPNSKLIPLVVLPRHTGRHEVEVQRNTYPVGCLDELSPVWVMESRFERQYLECLLDELGVQSL